MPISITLIGSTETLGVTLTIQDSDIVSESAEGIATVVAGAVTAVAINTGCTSM